MTQAVASKKEVKVLARIQYKNNPKAVIYIVRSSNGTDQYRTTIYDGKATGCSCPAKGSCYHMKQLQAKEQERLQTVPVVEAMAEAQAAMEQFARDTDANAYEVLAETKETVEERRLREEAERRAEYVAMFDPNGLGW